jgi:hypothetical protein
MCADTEIKQEKRPRGRPRKDTPPIEKQPKLTKGRPKKYTEGFNDHFHPKIMIDRKRLNELLEIEQKYLTIKNI